MIRIQRLSVLFAAISFFALPSLAQEIGPEPVAGEIRVDPDLSSATIAAGVDALPAGFYTEEIAPGYSFTQPVGVSFADDGRIFVVEKRGRVYIVENGVKLSTPFINLESEVLNHWDRGLLGFALDPDFLANGHAYLLYTYDRDGSGDYQRQDAASRVTRYTVSPADPNVLDLSTRNVLIGETFPEAIPSCYYSHTIGTLQFGSDGSLLVGAGDGADFGVVDPGGLHPTCFGAGRFPASEDIGAFRSQRLQSLAGKILRIDPATGHGYVSNPFYTGDVSDNESKVWVLGLRNPYRWTLREDGSTDPTAGQPGTLFIGDVGWGTWEDLHTSVFGGENFGWPCYEGPLPHSSYQAQAPAATYCQSPTFTHDAPTYYWHHSNTSLSNPTGLAANAIVAGDIYEGYRYPAGYADRLFYADYTRGWVSSSAVSTSNILSDHQAFGSSLGAVVDVRFDPVSSYLYWVNITNNQVYRLRHSNENAPPQAVASSDVIDGYSPLDVQFIGSTSSDPDGDPITYSWNFGDGATSTSADPMHTYTTTGLFQVSLAVTDNKNATSYAFLQIASGNTYPTATILSPENGQSFDQTDTVNLTATASDAEDPASSMTFDWLVIQRHNTHTHSDFFADQGMSTSFPLEQHGVPDEVSYLEIQLIVTDTGGLQDTVQYFVEVKRLGEIDITGSGTLTALVTSPTGSGNPNISVIADGQMPDETETDPLLHYDTYDGSSKTSDWIGYSFSGDRNFSKLILQQGVQSPAGGWFETLDVEVRRNGVWESVTYLSPVKAYEGNNGVNFDSYTLLFESKWGDAIRVIGQPGGTGNFVSVGELRVFGLTTPEFVADVRRGVAPLNVQFTDLSTISDPTGWQWDFGDGSSGYGENPSHSFSIPGTYDVTLTVHSLSGYYTEHKSGFIVVGEPGLLGQYYDGDDFTGTLLTRVDPSIDFEWGSGSPHASMGVDNYSVAWSGWLEPEYSESYSFTTTTDDGVRLWIGGELVVDQWIDQAPTEWSGTLPMNGGELYPVRMEYYEKGGGATARLEWESASQSREVIPSNRLVAAVTAPGITQYDPQYGEFGTRVTIFGQNLSSLTVVTFNGTAATSFGVISPTRIWADVPIGAASGPIQVITSAGSTSTGEFYVNDAVLAVEIEGLRAAVAGPDVSVSWNAVNTDGVEYFVIQTRRDDQAEWQSMGALPPSSSSRQYDYPMDLDEIGRYTVRLMIVDSDGESTYSAEVAFSTTLVDSYELEAPYPNPFSDRLMFGFTVRETQNVRIGLYDMLGRLQEVVLDEQVSGNDHRTVDVRGVDRLASGVYVLRLEGEHFIADRRVVRVK